MEHYMDDAWSQTEKGDRKLPIIAVKECVEIR